ncbi:MAG: hypothetical protein ACR2P2_05700 [Nakamurella sp.]
MASEQAGTAAVSNKICIANVDPATKDSTFVVTLLEQESLWSVHYVALSNQGGVAASTSDSAEAST